MNHFDIEPSPPLRSADFSDAGLIAYTRRFPESIRAVMNRMESAEPWPVDTQRQVVDTVAEWGYQLNDEALASLARYPSADILDLLAFVRASRCFAILDALTSNSDPDRWLDVLAAAVAHRTESQMSDLAYQLVAGRIAHLAQSGLLHRIFSPKRADRIAAVLMEVSR